VSLILTPPEYHFKYLNVSEIVVVLSALPNASTITFC
jgi:hypothetical protein